jgi:hypothetical protein
MDQSLSGHYSIEHDLNFSHRLKYMFEERLSELANTLVCSRTIDAARLERSES